MTEVGWIDYLPFVLYIIAVAVAFYTMLKVPEPWGFVIAQIPSVLGIPLIIYSAYFAARF